MSSYLIDKYSFTEKITSKYREVSRNGKIHQYLMTISNNNSVENPCFEMDARINRNWEYFDKLLPEQKLIVRLAEMYFYSSHKQPMPKDFYCNIANAL